MLCLMSVEDRVPQDHPLRPIKKMADEALRELSPVFDEIYASSGRYSVPPEYLLKALLLQALYSIRRQEPPRRGHQDPGRRTSWPPDKPTGANLPRPSL